MQMLISTEAAVTKSKKKFLNRLQKFDLAYKDYEASLLIDKLLENIDQWYYFLNIFT